jgi:hypothetical protein
MVLVDVCKKKIYALLAWVSHTLWCHDLFVSYLKTPFQLGYGGSSCTLR